MIETKYFVVLSMMFLNTESCPAQLTFGEIFLTFLDYNKMINIPKNILGFADEINRDKIKHYCHRPSALLRYMFGPPDKRGKLGKIAPIKHN